ncbi:hypothetical protein NFI96_031964, partial [Prochilodus magdalenae]
MDNKSSESSSMASTISTPVVKVSALTLVRAASELRGGKLEEPAYDPRKLLSTFSSLPLNPLPLPQRTVTIFEEKVNKIWQSLSSVPAPPSVNPSLLATNSLTCLSSPFTDAFLQLLESSNPTTCPLDPATVHPQHYTQALTLVRAESELVVIVTMFHRHSRLPVVHILKKPLLGTSDISSYRLNQLQAPTSVASNQHHSTETALTAVTEDSDGKISQPVLSSDSASPVCRLRQGEPQDPPVSALTLVRAASELM